MAPHLGYYPAPQENVEELWPQEPDREVKARYRIDLGTFVYPKTPFPYYFDVGEWVGVNASVNGQKGEADEVTEMPKQNELKGEKEVEKEVEVEGKMDVDGRDKEKEKEKEREVGNDIDEKEKEKDELVVIAETEQPKEKEKEKEKDNATEARAAEKTDVQKDEDSDMLDVETRATILIPNGYIPREKPPDPHIWGGGVIGRPIDPQRQAPPTPKQDKPDSPARPKKRRIYTDDSDLFLCALHSGWLTWSASARARDKGKDIRIEVRIIRCAGAGAGSVFAVGAGAFAGKYAPAVNGVVATNGLHRKNGNMKMPVVRKEEIVGRFIGGWGEKCFVKEFDGETEDEENDGRGLVSAGWGSGHDGSAIEVVNVEFVEVSSPGSTGFEEKLKLEQKGTANGLGRRNRSQRLLEYNERRAAVLGLPRLAEPPRLAGRKRRRNWDQWASTRRLPNATVLDIIPEVQEDETTEDERVELPMEPERTEEAQLMGVRTIVFGTGFAGDMRLGYVKSV